MGINRTKRPLRTFAAILAAAGTIGFASACNDSEPQDDGGTQQEDNGNGGNNQNDMDDNEMENEGEENDG
jgi:hypothetical protein